LKAWPMRKPYSKLSTALASLVEESVNEASASEDAPIVANTTNSEQTHDVLVLAVFMQLLSARIVTSVRLPGCVTTDVRSFACTRLTMGLPFHCPKRATYATNGCSTVT
jgi:hypothetical protein